MSFQWVRRLLSLTVVGIPLSSRTPLSPACSINPLAFTPHHTFIFTGSFSSEESNFQPKCQVLGIFSRLSHAWFCLQFVCDQLLTDNIKQGESQRTLQTDSLRWSPYSSSAGQHAVLHSHWSLLSRSLCWVFNHWHPAKCPQAVASCLIIFSPKSTVFFIYISWDFLHNVDISR